MNSRTSTIAGVALLVFAAVLILGIRLFTGGGGGDPPPESVTARGRIGSEKAGFLDDPDVKRILADRYGITVDYQATGSIKLVQADIQGQDFLWPGSQFARELYERESGQTSKAEVVFNSPIVLYAWAPVADALAAAGLVHEDGGAAYLDLAPTIALIEAGKTWADLGVPQLSGPMLLFTTDPTKSNSGNLFAGLLANVFSGGAVADESTIAAALPRIQRFYARLGFTEESTGFLFDQFLVRGIGSYPMIIGYENQLIEYTLEHEDLRDQLRSQVRILYLKPSVWSAHTLIALTSTGQRVLAAMRDQEIQDLAWERHGFRSGFAGSQKVPDFLQGVGVPAEIVQPAMPIPRSDIMEQIIAALESQAGPSPAAPTPTR